MKYKNLILALISIFVLTFSAEASNKKFKVLFVIPPVGDRVLASEAKSYITRELRSLRDVEDNESDPWLDKYLISVVPIAINTSDGQRFCIVVSYVIEKNERIEHNVLAGGPNELKALCEKVVAYFDTYWLAPERKKQ